ncbi:MAG: transporter associated domain-containing protein, partial [Calditrichia bacterium]
KISENSFLIDGRMSVEELNDELDMQLPEIEGVETISGFILNLLGSLPLEKEEVKYSNYKFIVEKINRNRILKVRVEIVPIAEDQSEKTEPEKQ